MRIRHGLHGECLPPAPTDEEADPLADATSHCAADVVSDERAEPVPNKADLTAYANAIAEALAVSNGASFVVSDNEAPHVVPKQRPDAISYVAAFAGADDLSVCFNVSFGFSNGAFAGANQTANAPAFARADISADAQAVDQAFPETFSAPLAGHKANTDTN